VFAPNSKYRARVTPAKRGKSKKVKTPQEKDQTPAERRASMTCPLCGSGLAFVRVLDGEEVQLGVSGLLHNNDLIMYDRM
jgi:hypothetical protein